ncbi:PEP-CTERM sorting domain-containing protein [Marinobacter salinexigens]|uniref:PEP-CTERM sorting domain-containing protein n=1 Tax=Marinobacter salinexigens TaxID=2919747 RepID=UPI001FEC540D|nr:PEP-CTERM sorting domain-containing protein [Marinobacter salinexigens]
MNIQHSVSAVGSVAAGLLFSSVTFGAMINCSEDATKNYMGIDDSKVAACLGSGVGNIGNGKNDDFLATLAGAGYTDVTGSYSPSFTQNGAIANLFTPGDESGTWSFNQTLWDDFNIGAIGFKFGTGNTPDEWFVYSLQDGVFKGDWNFFFGSANRETGGGLSHLTLYARDGSVTVTEPGTLALFGLGLIGLGLARRNKKAA